MDNNLAPLTPLFIEVNTLPPLAAGVLAGLLVGLGRSVANRLPRWMPLVLNCGYDPAT